MPTIEYSKVVGAGAGWTKAVTPDGRTVTVKGDRAVRNNNPGNLEYGPYAKSMGAIGVDNKGKRARGFAVFPSREIGLKAQAGWYAKEAKKHPDLTIGQAISKYAPSFENNTKAYTRALTKAGNITADTKLADISPEQMSSILSAQHAVEGNTKAVAYDESGAKIATITPSTMAGAPQVAATPAAPPQGLMAAMLGDPLGLQAYADEAPQKGLGAVDATNKMAAGLYGGVPQPDTLTKSETSLGRTVPSGDVGWSIENTIGKALGLVPSAPASNFPSRPGQVASNTMKPGVQVAETPADIERMTVEQAAATAPQTPDLGRFGAPTPATAERFAPGLQAALGPVSPEHYASVFSKEQQAANAADLGAQVGAMVGRPAPEAPSAPMSPDGRVADPFGNYKPGGLIGEASAATMPSEASAFTEQPSSVPTQAQRDSVAVQPGAVAPGLGAPQDVAALNVATPQGLGSYPGQTASIDPNMMGPQYEGLAPSGLTPDMAKGMPKADYAAKFGALDPTMAPNGPTISDPNSFPAAPGTVGIEGQTISGDFPSAPEEDSMFGPNTKRGLLGLALGGPIGGLLGAASGMLSGGLGSLGGGPAGRPSAAEGYNAGYGLGGMQQGINGPRGAIGHSLSNPGTYSQSRGFGLGSDLTNSLGAVTTYGPSGDIRANSGTMDAWGRVLGGLFDRPDKSKKGQSGKGGGLSQAGKDAIGKGSGGLY